MNSRFEQTKFFLRFLPITAILNYINLHYKILRTVNYTLWSVSVHAKLFVDLWMENLQKLHNDNVSTHTELLLHKFSAKRNIALQMFNINEYIQQKRSR